MQNKNKEKKNHQMNYININYNNKMGGVDRNDQLLRGYYDIEVKSRKFYKYLFYAAMDVAITDTFIMCKFFPTKNL